MTDEDKVNFVKQIKNGKMKADVHHEFILVNSTIQTIWKNRDNIVSAFGKSGYNFKRLKKSDHCDVDKVLSMRFKENRSENVLVSESLLITKAEAFAKLFDHAYFVCTMD